jgi:phage repressor protein C with HTH and peptisase S24 domain
MKAIDRVKKYIEYKGFNNSSFEKINDLSNGYIGTQLKRNADLGESVLIKILDNCLDLNAEWLLTGNGEMLKTKCKENATIKNGGANGGINGDKPNVKKTLPMESVGRGHLIPLYDGVVTAGTYSIADLSPQHEAVEYVDAGDWFRDATAAMRVHDDSMHPEYKSGSIVALRLVNDRTLIVYGQDYVIETNEFRVLKRLQRSEKEDHWLLASVNMDVWQLGPLSGRLIHEPFEIKIKSTSRLFRVLGNIKRNESSRIVFNKSKDQ